MNKKIVWQTALVLLQTLTGASLVVFGAFHLFGNSMINFGEDSFDFYTSYLDHTALFVKTFIWILFIGLLFHGLNGLRIVWRYLGKTSAVCKYLVDMNYRHSFLWYVHFSCGMVIGMAVIYHLAIVYWGAKEAVTTAEIAKTQLQNGYYFSFMVLLLASGIFHACYGLRNIFIKYGFLLNHQRKIELALLIVGLALAILGLNNLWVLRG